MGKVQEWRWNDRETQSVGRIGVSSSQWQGTQILHIVIDIQGTARHSDRKKIASKPSPAEFLLLLLWLVASHVALHAKLTRATNILVIFSTVVGTMTTVRWRSKCEAHKKKLSTQTNKK